MKIEGDDDIVVLVSARQTRDRNPVLRKGPLKGKRVELAPTTGITALETVAEAFMLEIFKRVHDQQIRVRKDIRAH